MCITDHRDQVVSTLTDPGWSINYGKSSLIPNTKAIYLGFELDSVGSENCPEIWITKDRAYNLRRSIKRLLSKTICSARQLARNLGQAIRMSFDIEYGKTMLHGAYQLVMMTTVRSCVGGSCVGGSYHINP